MLAGGLGDVKQDWFTPFLHGQATEPFRIHPRRTEQLRRGTKVVKVVGVFIQAQRDADLFIRKGGVVWRQRWVEVTPVMFGAAFDGDLQKPFGQVITSAALARQSNSQTRHMGDVAQLASESLFRRLFPEFHDRERSR